MPNAHQLALRTWYGTGIVPALARTAMTPIELAYRAAMSARNSAYDNGTLAVVTPVLPTISVGNVTVGGTGKTPIAAWLAGVLRERGARPAIVMRGYGGDESKVHERLNPTVPVVVDANRAAGIARAAECGADIAILDDAFQHRQIRRDADVVLVSAEQWTARRRLLPAGPWRETLGALARASAVVVTRKSASAARAIDVAAQLRAHIDVARIAIVRLALDELRDEAGAVMPIADIAGKRVIAIAGIGNPAAFGQQLTEAGAEVVLHARSDHHRFVAADVTAAAAAAREADLVVCTLKDAVKLGSLWPRAAPRLWYVTQRIIVERGHSLLDGILADVMSLRATTELPVEPAS